MDHFSYEEIGDGDGGEGGGHGGKGKAEAARVAPAAAAAGRLGGAPPPNSLPPWLLGAVEEPSPL